jgi:hypothetical protein
METYVTKCSKGGSIELAVNSNVSESVQPGRVVYNM